MYPEPEPRTATLHVLPPPDESDQVPEVGATPQLGQPETYSVLASTLRDLAMAGVEDTSHGRAALVLAERIDARADNGSAASALVREWQRQLTAALDAGGVADDPLARLLGS